MVLVSLGLLALGALMVVGAFGSTASTTGTVSMRQGETCRISYTTPSGQELTLVDDGGKYGCDRRTGDEVTIYYDPDDPADATTSSPRLMGIVGVALLVVATWMGVDSISRLRKSR